MTNTDVIAEALTSPTKASPNIDPNEERLYSIVASSPFATHISPYYGTLAEAIDTAKKRNITYTSVTNGRGNIFNLAIVDTKSNETVWSKPATTAGGLLRISRIEFTHRPLFGLGKPKKEIIFVESDFDPLTLFRRFARVELISIRTCINLALADKQLAEEFSKVISKGLFK